MLELRLLIFIPFAAGIFLFLLPESIKIVKGIIALIASAVSLWLAYQIYMMEPQLLRLPCYLTAYLEKYLIFNIDFLSKLVILFIGFFGLAIALYSLAYITRKKGIISYYSYYLITLGASFGAALSDHFLTFLFFWGILAITLYKLIKGYDEESSSAAKKSLIIIGASDSLLIMGIAIIWKMTGTLQMSGISITPSGTIGVIAFLALLIASLAKAGAFPVHTWIPGYAEKAPASSSAFLPASLDKLLGIYFLARISLYIFQMQSWMNLVLLIIGGITIIAAVMMALVQHNYKKLLGYHAVSQVGYMVTGIGLGTPLGIAGGLFHMINHALYKSGLFLTAGSVEKRTGEEDLENLGGLSKVMPLTFFTALICALAISGIPPLNGFASKWMIYQGIIDFGKGAGIANKLWILWLLMAVFGSALTLASFIKFISGIYLGRRKEIFDKIKEVSFLMWLPQLVIALLCIFFGVFAAVKVVPIFLEPITGKLSYIGIWKSTPVALLILVSIVIGYLVYLLSGIKKFRRSDSFIGGEKIQNETNYPTIEFYKTISNFKFISFFYRKAEKKWFDIYDLFKRLIMVFSKQFSRAHSGILPTYIIWMLAGLVILLIIIL